MNGEDAPLMSPNQRGQPGVNPSLDDSVQDAFLRVYRPVSSLLTQQDTRSSEAIREAFIRDLDVAFEYATDSRGFGQTSGWSQAGRLLTDTTSLMANRFAQAITPPDSAQGAALRAEHSRIQQDWRPGGLRSEVLSELADPAQISDIGAANRAGASVVLPGYNPTLLLGVIDTALPQLVGDAL